MFSLNESLHYYLYPYYINMGCGIEIYPNWFAIQRQETHSAEMSICSVVKNGT